MLQPDTVLEWYLVATCRTSLTSQLEVPVNTKTQGMGSVAPQTQGMGSVAPQTQGMGSVAPQTQGMGFVAPQTQGMGSVAPQAQGMGFVAPQAQGMGSVATQTQGMESVAPQTQGMGSVAPQTQAMRSVAPQTQGMGSVAPQTQGMGSVAPQTQGMGFVAPQTQGMGSAAPQAQGMGSVAFQAQGMGSVASQARGMGSVAPQTQGSCLHRMDEACDLGRLSSAPSYYIDPDAPYKRGRDPEPRNGCSVPLTSPLQSHPPGYGQDPSCHYIPLRRLQDLASMMDRESMNGSHDMKRPEPTSPPYFYNNNSEPAIVPARPDPNHCYPDGPLKIGKPLKNGMHPPDSYHMEPQYSLEPLHYNLGGHEFGMALPVYGQQPSVVENIGEITSKIGTPPGFDTELEDLVPLDWGDEPGNPMNSKDGEQKTSFLAMIQDPEIPNGSHASPMSDNLLSPAQLDGELSGQGPRGQMCAGDQSVSPEEDLEDFEGNHELSSGNLELQDRQPRGKLPVRIFEEGAVVWAKLGQRPWWPCRICAEPQQDVNEAGTKKPPWQYYVETLGDLTEKVWVPAKAVVSFKGIYQFERLPDPRHPQKLKEGPLKNTLKKLLSLNEQVKYSF
ncbi:unnamed protein product [Ranitomeya imitator]|uniref:PWWP domain-containing protein n=1 Tax=Ranitomeya imitator TaxID=111125 RepID=A0ABN9M1D1_9NEOB|nr:unnamed protein product [Ranitomeya imitator]